MTILKVIAALVFGATFYTLVMWSIFKDLGKLPPKK